MTTPRYLLTITRNENVKEKITLTNSNLEDGLNKYWYWRYDPLRLMPLLLSMSTILGLVIALPFAAIGITCNFIREVCWIIVDKTKTLGDNYTILDKEIKTLTPRKD